MLRRLAPPALAVHRGLPSLRPIDFRCPSLSSLNASGSVAQATRHASPTSSSPIPSTGQDLYTTAGARLPRERPPPGAVEPDIGAGPPPPGAVERTWNLAYDYTVGVVVNKLKNTTTPELLPHMATGGPWNRFVQWSYRRGGEYVFDKEPDICNSGFELCAPLPCHDVVDLTNIDHGTRAWRMQIFGAAFYWHLATTPYTGKAKDHNPDMMRGKDVLEVACMRGGGARYLMEAAGPRSYIATDAVEHSRWTSKACPPGLSFQCVDAHQLPTSFSAESFDFILCIQAVGCFGNLAPFMHGVAHVLRPGGKLLMADAVSRDQLKEIMTVTGNAGLHLDFIGDIGRNVHSVGLSTVPRGLSYLRFVVSKPESAGSSQKTKPVVDVDRNTLDTPGYSIMR